MFKRSAVASAMAQIAYAARAAHTAAILIRRALSTWSMSAKTSVIAPQGMANPKAPTTNIVTVTAASSESSLWKIQLIAMGSAAMLDERTTNPMSAVLSLVKLLVSVSTTTASKARGRGPSVATVAKLSQHDDASLH